MSKTLNRDRIALAAVEKQLAEVSEYERAAAIKEILNLTNPRDHKTQNESSADAKRAKQIANKYGFDFPEDLLDAWR
jgi:hypothetical protein